MHAHQIPRGHGRLVFPVLLIGTPPLVLFFAAGEDAIRWIALTVPALGVLAIHLLCLGLWRHAVVRRVRRRVNAALARGDTETLRRATAETAEAQRDWPGPELMTLAKGLDITLRRARRTARS